MAHRVNFNVHRYGKTVHWNFVSPLPGAPGSLRTNYLMQHWVKRVFAVKRIKVFKAFFGYGGEFPFAKAIGYRRLFYSMKKSLRRATADVYKSQSRYGLSASARHFTPFSSKTWGGPRIGINLHEKRKFKAGLRKVPQFRKLNRTSYRPYYPSSPKPAIVGRSVMSANQLRRLFLLETISSVKMSKTGEAEYVDTNTEQNNVVGDSLSQRDEGQSRPFSGEIDSSSSVEEETPISEFSTTEPEYAIFSQQHDGSRFSAATKALYSTFEYGDTDSESEVKVKEFVDLCSSADLLAGYTDSDSFSNEITFIDSDVSEYPNWLSDPYYLYNKNNTAGGRGLGAGRPRGYTEEVGSESILSIDWKMDLDFLLNSFCFSAFHALQSYHKVNKPGAYLISYNAFEVSNTLSIIKNYACKTVSGGPAKHFLSRMWLGRFAMLYKGWLDAGHEENAKLYEQQFNKVVELYVLIAKAKYLYQLYNKIFSSQTYGIRRNKKHYNILADPYKMLKYVGFSIDYLRPRTRYFLKRRKMEKLGPRSPVYLICYLLRAYLIFKLTESVSEMIFSVKRLKKKNKNLALNKFIIRSLLRLLFKHLHFFFNKIGFFSSDDGTFINRGTSITEVRRRFSADFSVRVAAYSGLNSFQKNDGFGFLKAWCMGSSNDGRKKRDEPLSMALVDGISKMAHRINYATSGYGNKIFEDATKLNAHLLREDKLTKMWKEFGQIWGESLRPNRRVMTLADFAKRRTYVAPEVLVNDIARVLHLPSPRALAGEAKFKKRFGRLRDEKIKSMEQLTRFHFNRFFSVRHGLTSYIAVIEKLIQIEQVLGNDVGGGRRAGGVSASTPVVLGGIKFWKTDILALYRQMLKSFDSAAAQVKYFSNSGELIAPASVAFKRHVRLKKFFNFTTTVLSMIIELESAATLKRTDTEPDADIKRPHIMFRRTKMITTMFPLNEWVEDLDWGTQIPNFNDYLKTANLDGPVAKSLGYDVWAEIWESIEPALHHEFGRPLQELLFAQMLCRDEYKEALFRKQSPSYLTIKDKLFFVSMPIFPGKKDFHFSRISHNRYKIVPGPADGIRRPAGMTLYAQNNRSPSFFPLAGYISPEDILADSRVVRAHGLKDNWLLMRSSADYNIFWNGTSQIVFNVHMLSYFAKKFIGFMEPRLKMYDGYPNVLIEEDVKPHCNFCLRTWAEVVKPALPHHLRLEPRHIENDFTFNNGLWPTLFNYLALATWRNEGEYVGFMKMMGFNFDNLKWAPNESYGPKEEDEGEPEESPLAKSRAKTRLGVHIKSLVDFKRRTAVDSRGWFNIAAYQDKIFEMSLTMAFFKAFGTFFNIFYYPLVRVFESHTEMQELASDAIWYLKTFVTRQGSALLWLNEFIVLFYASLYLKTCYRLTSFMAKRFFIEYTWGKAWFFMCTVMSHVSVKQFGFVGVRIGFHGKFGGKERAYRMYHLLGNNPCMRSGFLTGSYSSKQCKSMYGITHIHIWMTYI